MKTIKSIGILLASFSLFLSCQKNPENPSAAEEKMVATSTSVSEAKDMDSQTNLYGIYTGVLPCADCEGIETEIELLENNTIVKTTKYLGKSDNTFTDKGTFSKTDTISIKATFEDDSSQWFEIGQNEIFQLDQDGNRISGSFADRYKLVKKRKDEKLEDKTWVLVELMGKTIEPKEKPYEMYLKFVSSEGLLTGSDGCNQFSGNYELLKGSRYKSGPFASTMKACLDMTYAVEFLNAVEKSDTYILTDSTLSITKARMAIMAKFKLKSE
jgi:heat shock protein HslJ